MEKVVWYRSRQGRMLGGVCAGLSELWNLDVKLVRVFFILAGMVSGLGVVLYMALWLTTPMEGMASDTPRNEVLDLSKKEIKAEAQLLGQGLQDALHHEDPQVRFVIRLAVAILGAMMLKKMRPKVGHDAHSSCQENERDAEPDQAVADENETDEVA